jgi:hypothetical protein
MNRLGIALAVVALTPMLAWAHPGGLDKNGCHHDNKAGDYHCHKGALSGKHFKDKAEAEAALKSGGATAEKKADKAEKKAEKAEKKADTAEKKADAAEKKADSAKKDAAKK